MVTRRVVAVDPDRHVVAIAEHCVGLKLIAEISTRGNVDARAN
jgi:hypothetical protein